MFEVHRRAYFPGPKKRSIKNDLVYTYHFILHELTYRSMHKMHARMKKHGQYLNVKYYD